MRTVYRPISNSGIGPNTIKEAHQIHVGVWKGTVKIWSPYGYYKEMKKIAEEHPDDWEEKDKHYQIFLLNVSFFMKWAGILIALRLGASDVVISCGGLIA